MHPAPGRTGDQELTLNRIYFLCSEGEKRLSRSAGVVACLHQAPRLRSLVIRHDFHDLNYEIYGLVVGGLLDMSRFVDKEFLCNNPSYWLIAILEEISMITIDNQSQNGPHSFKCFCIIYSVQGFAPCRLFKVDLKIQRFALFFCCSALLRQKTVFVEVR